MRRYSVFIHEDVLASAPKSGAQQHLVMDFIRGLADNPHLPGDYTEQDETGRALEIKIVGRYAVTYWADHPVKEIKVVHVQIAGR